MKKYRILSILLLCVILSLLTGVVAAGSGSAILDEMQIEAKSAILLDADYGEVLFDQDAYVKRYPASITKVMTAMLTIEAINRGELSESQIVTLGDELSVGIGEGGSTADLKTGEELALKDLLACALVKSANEACNALAVTVSGDVDTFVALMNQRAAELGMEDTHFTNTHGYHDDDHYTTAYDIALMCQQAMNYELFRAIVSSKTYTVPATNLSEQRVLYDTNGLISNWHYLGYTYEYATGVKTGSTPEAGLCLASSAEKNGKHLIAVVLGAERGTKADGSVLYTQFSESKRLLAWGFQNFSRQEVLNGNNILTTVPVTLGVDTDCVSVHPGGTLEVCLPNDMDPSTFTVDWSLTDETLEAPVTVGQVLGTVTVSSGVGDAKTIYGTLDLVAYNSVERSDFLYTLDRIKKVVSSIWFKILILVVIIAIVVLVIRHRLHRPRRGSKGRAYAYAGGRRGGTRRRGRFKK